LYYNIDKHKLSLFQGSGFHRYVFLVYQQPNGQLNNNEKYKNLKNKDSKGRYKQILQDLVKELGFNINDLQAGNFFRAQWDKSVG